MVRFDPTNQKYPPGLDVLQMNNYLVDETLTAKFLMGPKRLFHGNAEFNLRLEWFLHNTVRTWSVYQRVNTLYYMSPFPEDPTYQSQVLDSVRDRKLRGF